MQQPRVRSCVFLRLSPLPPDPAPYCGAEQQNPPPPPTPPHMTPHPRSRVRTRKHLRDLALGRTTPPERLKSQYSESAMSDAALANAAVVFSSKNHKIYSRWGAASKKSKKPRACIFTLLIGCLLCLFVWQFSVHFCLLSVDGLIFWSFGRKMWLVSCYLAVDCSKKVHVELPRKGHLCLNHFVLIVICIG